MDDIDDDDIDDGPPCRPLNVDVASDLVSGPRSETPALAGLGPNLRIRRAPSTQYSVPRAQCAVLTVGIDLAISASAPARDSDYGHFRSLGPPAAQY